jgi:hypothetical protein
MDFDQAKMQTTYTTNQQVIYHIKINGQNVWTLPNRLMYNDHLYGWDENQNAEFPADVKANGTVLVKTNDSRLSDARASNDVKTWAKDGLVESYTGDMNALVTTGFYQGQSLSNAPTTGWYFYIVSRYRSDSNWVSQIAMSFGSGNTGNKTYTRMKINNVWSAWVELYSTGNKPNLADLPEDTTHRLITDAERTTWNAKQDALGFTAVPNTRKINNVALDADITITPELIGAMNASYVTPNMAVVTDGLGIATIISYSTFKSNLSLSKSDIGLQNVLNYGIATQAEAEAGTATEKYMTPQRVKQAIDYITPHAMASDITATGNLTTSHRNKFVRVNSASEVTVTIPLSTFNVGDEIHLVRYGAGEVTIARATSVSLYSEGSATENAGKKRINAQYQAVTLKCVASNVWVLIGALKT